MALDVTVLTTRAECDEVLDDLAAELDGYQQRTSNLEFADRRTSRSQADAAGQLAGVEAEIAAYTAILASPDITATMRKQNETKLRRANDRRDNLTDTGSSRSAASRLLAAVDTQQVQAQVDVLTEAQTQVTTHRATLPA
ncbi:hypothetical protein J0X19_00945 [Hymenobacter sp. BT186]|uniref:Uncharacterized protein n=1 Tax=Hymenobacter telluris TaxID=2816474 RepID=A0A939EV63_9BACT|nr:hypothetical protein [Hymenobacter telluris]MBO0356498.1 hypothetical protein [Hymenobacter telluris]MBW3372522.1 hypothetical protein [Hymenobacter norwichensis]